MDMFTRCVVSHVHCFDWATKTWRGKVAMPIHNYMSHVMRKLDFCICENKGADQLHSDCQADQHLCFRYMDSRIPLL